MEGELIVIKTFNMYGQQIPANRGPDSRFVIEASTKAL